MGGSEPGTLMRCFFVWLVGFCCCLLHWVLFAACKIFFFFELPHVGSSSLTRIKPGPLPWEHRALAVGPPGKAPSWDLYSFSGVAIKCHRLGSSSNRHFCPHNSGTRSPQPKTLGGLVFPEAPLLGCRQLPSCHSVLRWSSLCIHSSGISFYSYKDISHIWLRPTLTTSV